MENSIYQEESSEEISVPETPRPWIQAMDSFPAARILVCIADEIPTHIVLESLKPRYLFKTCVSHTYKLQSEEIKVCNDHSRIVMSFQRPAVLDLPGDKNKFYRLKLFVQQMVHKERLLRKDEIEQWLTSDLILNWTCGSGTPSARNVKKKRDTDDRPVLTSGATSFVSEEASNISTKGTTSFSVGVSSEVTVLKSDNMEKAGHFKMIIQYISLAAIYAFLGTIILYNQRNGNSLYINQIPKMEIVHK
ncbi:hypothetical protein SK128_020678 [Halocaridina rubra]|uniref:Uncharacterized protein n=1 Tax=Halocaridina rubra TaxID=373956 RepID=A0AAN8WSF1_HALRR